MVQPASVQDVLKMFHLKDSDEPDLAAAIRSRFGLADDADLEDDLRGVPPGEVLAVLAAVVAPVAAMVRELYAWLAEFADVRSTANLSVRLTGDHMTALILDPERYQAYEQAVVDSVSRIEYVPSRLPVESPLYDFHDFHQPPSCLRSAAENEARCSACRPDVAGAFERFERLLRAAASSGAKLVPESNRAESPMVDHFIRDRRRWFVENLPRHIDEVLKRKSFRRCSYAVPRMAEYLDRGLPDLAECFHEVTAEEIRKFFDLPYWKARWQLYEAWLLHVVLRSYGTAYWRPNLTGGVWDLKAGSTNRTPVATASLAKRRQLRCYYQYQSTPPRSLRSAAGARPELLITRVDEAAQATVPGDAGEPVILAVEAKARMDYSVRQMEAETFVLLEWEPKWVLGASYFSLTGAEELHARTIAGANVALGEGLVPDSTATTALRDWLCRMWTETCGEHVTVIAVDASSSMPRGAAVSRLAAMASTARDGDSPGWLRDVTIGDRLYLTTFGAGKAKLYRLDELTANAVSPYADHLRPTRGYTSLEVALNRWRAELAGVVRLCRRLDLHFVTDGHLSDRDIAVIDELDRSGHVVHVHLVDGGPTARPELDRLGVR